MEEKKQTYAKVFEIEKEIVSIFSIIIFIVTIVMEKFTATPQYFYIPLILFGALFFMTVVMFYNYLKNSYLKSLKNRIWFATYFFTITCGTVFSYLIHLEILK